jgi:hypothetical protein
MEKRIFLLETRESSGFVRIVQAIFGILCILIALYWVIFQFGSLRADSALWITIIFLVGFGAYQVAAGFGKIKRFVEIGSESVILKQNSFLPAVEMKASVIEKIIVYPVSILFILGNRKKMILRFGMSYTDIIDPVKDAVGKFAAVNGIEVEEMREDI